MYVGISTEIKSLTTISSKHHFLSIIIYSNIGTSYSLTTLPTLSSTVTVILSNSPFILGDDGPVIIPIFAGVVCFVIVLLTIMMITITLLFFLQRRQKRKMNVSSGKDGVELTMTNQLYSQHNPPERTLINPLYTGNCYNYYIYSANNGLDVTMSVLYLLYKLLTTLNYKSN